MDLLADHKKANGTRLIRLLIDKGTEAMRTVFDSIHHPATLTATLKSNLPLFRKLQTLGNIALCQMDILFPPSGAPSQSKDFDINLLFILLRNICCLQPPVSTGSWDDIPPSWDTSREANLARIKYYRDKVYGHITTTEVDDVTFQSHWNDISAAVIGLGVSEGEVNFLKFAPLDVNFYPVEMRKWKEKEHKVEVTLEENELWQKETAKTLHAAEKHPKKILTELEAISHKAQVLLEEQLQKDVEHNDDVSWFEEYFLQPKSFRLKDEICQKLDSFEWLTGAYGITGPSTKFPYGHLFLTVKREFKKQKVLDDLKEAFGERSIKYIELLRQRKEPPQFYFL